MYDKEKLIYIISLICLGLATIGGGMALVGFFFDGSVIQLVGVLYVIVFYLTSVILDFVFLDEKKEEKKMKEKGKIYYRYYDYGKDWE